VTTLLREDFRKRCSVFAFVPSLFSERYDLPTDSWLDTALDIAQERAAGLGVVYNARFMCMEFAALYASLLRVQHSQSSGFFKRLVEPDRTLAVGVAILQPQNIRAGEHAILAILTETGWKWVDCNEGGSVEFDLSADGSWVPSHFVAM
jgi:hypothetical protein